MSSRVSILVPVLAACLALACSGCPGLGINIPGFTGVTVEVYNDTPYDVDPNIKFDDDPGFFAGLFPSEELTTGRLAPGERLRFNFDCDKVGTLVSDSAEQFIFGASIAEADDSNTFEREEDFDCGDVVEFRYIGTDSSFGVVVSVNGRVID